MSGSDEKRSFGEYIRRKRQDLGLTQKELAGTLFVTGSTVSKWERGLSYPDVSMVTAICAALHITEHEFFAACDDDQVHTQEQAAKRWRKMVAGMQWFFAVGYAVAIAACFICDLAVFHTLDWFWIVLTSIALGFCFTNLPFLVRRNRLSICLGAASGCLLLLLLSCWLYAGGWWIVGGLAITAVCLALLWSWWAIWRFYGRHLPELFMAVFTVWLVPLLAVIWTFAGGDWLFSLALPLAGTGAAFLWAGFAVIRWLPVNRLLKGGILALLASFATPVFNVLCDLLIVDTHGPRFWDYLSVGELFVRRAAGDMDWVNILTFQLMLAASIIVAVAGAVLEVRRRKRG